MSNGKIIQRNQAKKKSQIILYNYLLKNYSAKIRRYISKKLLDEKKYNPDTTLVIRSNRYRSDTINLWFDLFYPQDIILFAKPMFLKKIASYLHLVDIFILGVDKRSTISEFYLEFSNNKIEVIYELIPHIKKEFGVDCGAIVERVKEIKHFLDMDNYYMIGFRYNNKEHIEEIDFSFNVKKDYFVPKIIGKNFLSLFEDGRSKPFRGEQSYIIKSSGNILERRGWMIDKPITKCANIFKGTFHNIKWKESLSKALEFYSHCEYNFCLNIGWFSYILRDKRLNQINLKINFDYA